MSGREVFVTGGTGYLGRALLPALARRGHRVRALTRGRALPPGCAPVPGDALSVPSLAAALDGDDTVVHLVGVAHPAPWKAAQFEAVDVASVRALLAALPESGAPVRHLVYLSVAQPAPAMHAYVAARARCEAAIRGAGIPATFVRPWYVLGPGHRWAALLRPLYAVAERLPATRATALRLGLVTLSETIAALVWAVEHPPAEVRVLDVPAIRAVGAGRPVA